MRFTDYLELDIQNGRNEGRIEGRAEGRKEGQDESRRLVAKNLAKEGISREIICRVTGLSASEAETILEAESVKV